MAVKRRANKRPIKQQDAVVDVVPVPVVKSKHRSPSGAPDTAWICAAVGFLLYVRSVWECDFPYDDGPGVRLNPDVLNGNGGGVMSPWSTIFKHDFWGTDITSEVSHKSYRPLVVASLRLDAMISSDAKIFHLTNSLLYAATCWLVVDVALSLPGEVFAPTKNKRLVILLAGLLFASHPIHTEAVAQIVGRAEILASIFCLVGWRLKQSWHTLSAAVCFAAACLCKETAVVVPIILVGGDIAVALLSPKGSTRANSRITPFGSTPIGSIALNTLVSLGYLLFRSWLFSERESGGSLSADMILLEDNFVIHLGPVDKLRTALHIQAKYLQLLLWPHSNSCDYSLGVIEPISTWLSPEMAVVAIAAYAVVIMAWVSLERIRKTGDATMLVALGWMFLPLLPASHVVGIGTTMAERLLFMPSIGLAMLICHLVGLRAAEVSPGSKYAVALACCIAWFGFTTAARVPDWADSSTLMNADVLKHPRSIKLNLMLSEGFWGENATTSEKSFKHATKAQKVAQLYSESLIKAPYATGLRMMAFQKTRTSLWPEANLTEALELVNTVVYLGKDGMTLNDIAFIFAVKGTALLKMGMPKDASKLQEAVAAFEVAVENDRSKRAPYTLYCNFALTLTLLQQREAAYGHFQRCFRRKKFTEIGFSDLNNYGNLLVELSGAVSKDVASAKVWGEKAIDDFLMILSHPDISENDVGKWKWSLNRVRDLLSEPEPVAPLVVPINVIS